MTFEIGDKVVVTADWLDPKDKGKKRAFINGFQQNGRTRFAKLLWLGRETARLQDDYGNLFHEDELKLVEKKK